MLCSFPHAIPRKRKSNDGSARVHVKGKRGAICSPPPLPDRQTDRPCLQTLCLCLCYVNHFIPKSGQMAARGQGEPKSIVLDRFCKGSARVAQNPEIWPDGRPDRQTDRPCLQTLCLCLCRCKPRTAQNQRSEAIWHAVGPGARGAHETEPTPPT